MTYKELIDKYDDEAILIRLFELYPDMEKSSKGFEDSLTRLRQLEPAESKCTLNLEDVPEDDGESWVHVCGREDNINYAIEFTPWNEWLGMTIEEKTLEDFTELDVAAHSLWEMTWFGFTEEEIQSDAQEIKDRADEVRKDLE